MKSLCFFLSVICAPLSFIVAANKMSNWIFRRIDIGRGIP